MPMPKDKHRFPEILDLLQRALEAPRGIAVQYPEGRRAYTARMKMYAKIKDSRQQSKEMFPHDDPRWGLTPYDCLSIRMDPPYQKGVTDLVPTRVILEKIDGDYYEEQGMEIEEL